MRAARAYVYFSQHLARFALIGDAVCAGRVSTDQAQAMLHGLKHLPDEVTDDQLTTVQNVLIAEADELHPNDLRILANHTVAVLFPEAEDDRLATVLEREEARARRDRFLTHGRTASGGVKFKGQLSRVAGEQFITLVTAYAQQLKRDHAQGVDRLDPQAEPNPTTAQFHADALAAIVDEVSTRECAPVSGGDRPRVSVLLDYDTLVSGTGAATLLGSGEPIPATTARHLACDADIIPVVLNSTGAVLDVGRTQRLFPRDVRHALEVRDRGCVFPNCDAPPQRCEAHHLTPWHLGGSTSAANGALVCRHHHRLVEPDPNAREGTRWTIALDDHGFPHVFPPTRVDPTRQPKQHRRFRQRE